MKISEVLDAKPVSEVFTLGPDSTVRQLLASLAEHNIGAVVVSADGRQVDGIVSERDIVRRLTAGDHILDAPVGSIMTTTVFTCNRDHDVEDLLRVMTDRRFRHVPVVDDGALIGVISIGDVVKRRMDQLEFERDQLDAYVHQG